ncbi:phosphatidate cytidylyltransferase [Streptobacillus moniliformis]|uniref:Phosphatidate cytidylyltransferase n=1 Tax=Streptobacillus moniliformis (strain ATCC 14647 / DSM 12112 / NCTC 10651 / 9901) TaxID=519441 RepID=D1AXP4_STRM9|nr:phosphatidate cytidylyltransferase [Streptobacillus moniliformis]ACZ01070.1 phosphatidate cytidylyltransferase [Streptobacillus moniliformis DSM 12112]AVL42564.1 phosphatidate cytidylyltransferase [Streptobacillus moniliformis]QXW65842.1 phosphatidate cytidylyltransferase [Streptobacillus moniliformis]SQA13788.1 Phosphatidate cytidylyltransferase [Streptobacillus moniliformis]
MLSRLFVIVLALPLLIYILLSGEVSFLVFNVVVIAIALHEFYTILKNKGNIVYYKTGILIGMFLPIFIYYREDISFFFRYIKILNKENIIFDVGGYIIFATLLIAIIQILSSRIKNSTNELMLTLFGIIYIPLFSSYMVSIREGLNNGRIILLYSFFSIWAADTFAYIVGKLFGGKIFKKRLSEKISPKKSIEGFFGGILGVFIVGLYFEYIYNVLVNILSYFKILTYVEKIDKVLISQNVIKLFILSILIAIFSVLGDLFESKFKREFGVKDSGRILMGHGGFLDRFDSALFVLPIVYYFIKYFI